MRKPVRYRLHSHAATQRKNGVHRAHLVFEGVQEPGIALPFHRVLHEGMRSIPASSFGDAQCRMKMGNLALPAGAADRHAGAAAKDQHLLVASDHPPGFFQRLLLCEYQPLTSCSTVEAKQILPMVLMNSSISLAGS